MSSIGKACIELSKSIKGFRFNRSPTEQQKDFVNISGASPPNPTSSPSSLSPASARPPSGGSGPVSACPTPSGESTPTGGDSVANTITRVIRSATNRVRSFPSGELRNGLASMPTASTAVSPNTHASPSTYPPLLVHLSLDAMWMDEKFLRNFFRYFAGTSDLCALTQVCRKWKEILYIAEERLWVGVTPIVNCKELPKSTEERRDFYLSIELRGFDSVCLQGAQDSDITNMEKEFEYGRTGLTSVAVRSSNLSDVGLESLINFMTSATSIELSGCNDITEAGLWHCLDARIVKFSVSDCINVADDTIGAVSQLLPALKELNLQAYHVTDGALAAFSARQSCNLLVLRLQSCWEITNHGVVNLVRALPCLTVLSLSGCSKITDDGVEVIAENLRQLRSLDLSWCSRITDASLECIACDLGQLEELILDRCFHVTDIGVGYLSTMTSLCRLFLRWCTQLRDFGLQHLYTMRSLQVLSLAGCSLFSSTGLLGLSQLTSLHELELTNCPAILNPSIDVVKLLHESLPSCVIIG